MKLIIFDEHPDDGNVLAEAERDDILFGLRTDPETKEIDTLMFRILQPGGPNYQFELNRREIIAMIGGLNPAIALEEKADLEQQGRRPN